MKKKLSVEEALIQSLKDARAFEAGNKSLTTRIRELPGPAPEYTSKKVKDLGSKAREDQQMLATGLWNY